MKQFLLLSVMLITSVYSYSQSIGIGTTTPDASAILHVESVTKGLLIPRMTTAQRTTMTGQVEGLLVYDLNADQFCFYNGSSWLTLNEMVRPAGLDAQTATHTGNMTVNGNFSTANIAAANITASSVAATGNITATNVTATGIISGTSYALNTTGHGPIPQGGIIMWSGDPASLPQGWALCDGQSGRPNLSGRFIVGYQLGSTDYGAIHNMGGAAAVALNNINQIPSHTHSITTGGDGTIDDVPGGYIKARQNADLRVSSAHLTGRAGGPYNPAVYNYDYNGFPCDDVIGATPVGCNTNWGNLLSITPESLNTTPHENRPPYYVLAYIMKL